MSSLARWAGMISWLDLRSLARSLRNQIPSVPHPEYNIPHLTSTNDCVFLLNPPLSYYCGTKSSVALSQHASVNTPLCRCLIVHNHCRLMLGLPLLLRRNFFFALEIECYFPLQSCQNINIKQSNHANKQTIKSGK